MSSVFKLRGRIQNNVFTWFQRFNNIGFSAIINNKDCPLVILAKECTRRNDNCISTRSRVVKQQQFEYGYLFGAVCPSTGQTGALIILSIGIGLNF